MPPFIQVQGLEYAYPQEDGQQVHALRGVDLTIDRGEFVAIIGPNGSGKSTLARHFNGLLLPTAGQVWVDGLLTADPNRLPTIRQRVGMVFQNPDNQLVASTVEEDIAFGPENLALPPDEIRRRVDEALKIVGLTDYATHPPHMLSGGQKQKVAIAGALATRPDCIVFDEPNSMLDPPGRQQVLGTICRLNAEGMTIVLITQSMDEAAIAGRIVVMDAGRIALDGPPKVVFAAPDREGDHRGKEDGHRGMESDHGGKEGDHMGSPLLEMGLDRPFAAEIAERLRQQGIPLPAGLLTVEELAAALC
ncbi:MAG: energy-coupling factor transporter ATPase [Anaerolineae bacterium]|nr:energy-coupling factor transporter ATPase [Anaerolineae bacterium]